MTTGSVITKDMTISETMTRFPATEQVFIQYKLHCVGCSVAEFETIEEGARTHQVQNLNQLLADLNKAVK